MSMPANGSRTLVRYSYRYIDTYIVLSMPRSRIINLSNAQTFTAVNLLSDPGAILGPVQVPQCAQISFAWSLEDGKVAHNVLYGRYSGGFAGTVAQCNSIIAALTTGAQWTALAAFFSTSNIFSFVTIRDVNTINQPIIQNSAGGAAGTSASPALPLETAAVITLRTALVGRANRGRIYIPSWATNALGAGNIIAAAAVTALQNWANTIPTAFTAQGYTLVIGQKARASYTGTTGAVHPPRAATSTAVTSLSVRDNHWDSQRRRGLK